MADKYIEALLKFSGALPNPIVTGNRRLTMLNLSKLFWGLAHGSQYKQGGFTLTVADTLVAASATCTCAAVIAGNTLTIAGQALTATKQRATATVTCASATAGQTVTVNGQVFTAVAGAAVEGEATFSIDTGDTETAASLAAQVAAYGGSLVNGLVSAFSAAAVCTLYAEARGTSGNSLTLTSSDAGTLLTSGALFTGGAAIANNQFDFTTNALCADSIAYAINNSTTAAVKRVTAVSDGVDVVTITAKIAGDAGEAITLTSSGATLTVTGSGFLASGSQGAPTQWTV